MIFIGNPRHAFPDAGGSFSPTSKLFHFPYAGQRAHCGGETARDRGSEDFGSPSRVRRN